MYCKAPLKIYLAGPWFVNHLIEKVLRTAELEGADDAGISDEAVAPATIKTIQETLR